jgi:hypothetical protein
MAGFALTLEVVDGVLSFSQFFVKVGVIHGVGYFEEVFEVVDYSQGLFTSLN